MRRYYLAVLTIVIILLRFTRVHLLSRGFCLILWPGCPQRSFCPCRHDEAPTCSEVCAAYYAVLVMGPIQVYILSQIFQRLGREWPFTYSNRVLRGR